MPIEENREGPQTPPKSRPVRLLASYRVSHSTMPPNTDLPASQHALLLPEILSRIFHHMHYDDPWGANAELYSLLLVSRLWYREAVPYLWRKLDKCTWPKLHLHHYFLPIASERRQFYAGMVQSVRVSIGSIPSPDRRPRQRNVGNETYEVEVEGALRDTNLKPLQWPRLRAISLTVQGWGGRELPFLPKLEGNQVVRMGVNPHFEWNPEFFGVAEEDWEHLLGRIPDVFPHLEAFEFEDSACVQQDVLQRFASRLPRLKHFDYHSVKTDYGQVERPYTLDWGLPSVLPRE